MKILVEFDIVEKFEEPLTNDSIIEIISDIFYNGVENEEYLEADYKILKVYK